MFGGIDIGGTKIGLCVGEIVNGEIKIIKKCKYPTPKGMPPYEVLAGACTKLKEMSGGIAAVGISCGGPLDSRKGLILSPPNLPGWNGIEAAKYVSEKMGVPTAIQNDANACALAEWKFGAGRGTQNCVFLTFGTGMGAGLILNGSLYSGTSDMAGEVGHIRLENDGPVGFGKRGSFEGFCSGGGIAQLGRIKARELLQVGKTVSFCESLEKLDGITAQSVAEKALEGNRDAAEVYEYCGDKLGKALALLIDILNPEVIVLGSIYQRSGELLQKKAFEVIEKEALSFSRKVCKILPAVLGDEIGNVAALVVAETALENNKN